MDEALVKKFKISLNNMRAKVIEAKGEGVKGLSPLPKRKTKDSSPSKTRGAKS